MISRQKVSILSLFCLFVQLANCQVAYSADPDDKKLGRFSPIALIRNNTDKKIKQMKVPNFPKDRPTKDFDPKSKLSLDDALAIVNTNYPKLLQGHIEVEKASAKTLEKSGAFDPVLHHISEYKRVQDIVVTGGFKNAVHNESLLELPTRSGIKLFAEIRVNPNDASSPILQSGRSGEYTGGMIVPLLRNFIVNPARAAEQKAKMGEPLANINLNLSRMNVLFDCSVSYWDWYAAYQRLLVVKGLLNIAVSRESLVRRRVDDGDLPKLAITEVEKEIRLRQGDLYKAQRDLAKHAFKLSLFLWSDRGDTPPDLNQANLFTQKIKPVEINRLEIESGIKQALQLRPELAAIEIQREMVNVDLSLAKNLFLPKLDLIYRQGYDTGVNGIRNVFTGGVKVAIPIRQRKARGLIRQAKANLKKLDVEEEFMKRKIIIEVKDAASELNASYQRFIQAGEELEKSRAVEYGERQRFDLGDSSLFLVNRRERDRAETEKKRIDVFGRYLKALAAFNAVTGNL